jgi:hypothetical protein
MSSLLMDNVICIGREEYLFPWIWNDLIIDKHLNIFSLLLKEKMGWTGEILFMNFSVFLKLNSGLHASIYSLSHASIPFCSGYFWDSLFFPGRCGLWSSYFKLPIIIGKTGVIFLLRWGLMNNFVHTDLEMWSSWSQPPK